MVNGIDISNMDACIQDVRNAPNEQGPVDINDFHALLGRLSDISVGNSFPNAYITGAVAPFINFLQGLGSQWYNRIMQSTEQELFDNHPSIFRTLRFYKQIMPDVSHAILQQVDGFHEHASDAFQELVSDLFDGYLSDASREGVHRPDLAVLPPLIKWGDSGDGPYTWTIGATSQLGLNCPIVHLPVSEASQGLVGWSSIGHEVAGHDILHADTGLLEELGEKVNAAVSDVFGPQIGKYWEGCVDEAASDVLGLLNMGPAAGIGLVAYFRSFDSSNVLSNVGHINGPHPAGLTRGIIAAEIVKGLTFGNAANWSQVIEDETMQDWGNRDILLVDQDQLGNTFLAKTIAKSDAIASARIAAQVISQGKMAALEDHSLGEIQDWSDEDERIASELATSMKQNERISGDYRNDKFFATHVVAGAVIEALKSGGDVIQLFKKMKEYLVEMHQHNSRWDGFVALHGRPFQPHHAHPRLPSKITVLQGKSPAEGKKYKLVNKDNG